MEPTPLRGPAAGFGGQRLSGEPFSRSSLFRPRQAAGLATRFVPGLRQPDALRTPADRLGPVLGRLGSLEVRLATTPREVRRAQRLRFQVFYGEMAAVATAASRL